MQLHSITLLALTLSIGQFLSQVGEFGPQLRHQDEAFLLLVHHLHGLQDLLLWRLLPELLVHDAQQGGEVQLATPLCSKPSEMNHVNVTRRAD